MDRPVWAAYSVFDHRGPGAFLADVVLYDHLVVPVPSPHEPAEWDRWKDEGWDPARQRKLLSILGPLATQVPWNQMRRTSWADSYLKARPAMGSLLSTSLAGEVTANGLFDQIPVFADRLIATSPYHSLAVLEEDLRIHRLSELDPLPQAAVSAVVGRELLLPKDDSRSETDLLSEAVEVVTNNDDYRNARATLQQRLKQFSRDGATDVASLQAAVSQIKEACDELERAVRKRKIWVSAGRVFAFSQIVLGALAAPLTVVGAGLVVAGIGQFSATEMLADQSDPRRRAPDLAMLLDAHKELDL